MAFLIDVSPFFMSTGMSTNTSDFLFLLIMFPVLYCVRFILSQFMVSSCFFELILHQNFYLYVKTRLLMTCFQLSTMVRRSVVYKFLPIGCMWQCCMHMLLHDVVRGFKELGLIPYSHRERRLQYYKKFDLKPRTKLRWFKTLIFLLSFYGRLVNGLTVKWVHVSYDPSLDVDIHRVHHRIGGRDRLFLRVHLEKQRVLRRYLLMSSSDRGWDSIPKRFIYTQDRLSLEGWLLGKAFDKFLKTIPVKHMMPFRMEFISQRFAPAANNCVGDGIPDMSVIFGAVAPVELVVYQSSCHLQSQSNHDMSICFDTGCSMSSTFSIDDFEEPPTKGNFGQLRTITNVVPIVAAGMI